MKGPIRYAGSCALLLVAAAANAQDISLRWGLENAWSYRETTRKLDEDATVGTGGKQNTYRTFAFNNAPQVVDTMLQCFGRHFTLWEKFNKTQDVSGPPDARRRAFDQYKASEDPTCDQHAKKQAPVLYFDFVANTKDEFVLEAIEITTLRFSEYKGGGFAKDEVWYDITLSHKEGRKRYDVSKRLVFSGTGRCVLRFWSDNFYENQGWIAPMGEYLIDIKFIFSSAGKQKVISTGAFKIDV